MSEILERYLYEHGNFTGGEIEAIISRGFSKKLFKRQFLLKAGDVCRHNTFVLKGCLRAFRIGKDGAEHICAFAAENSWMSDAVSLLTGNPAASSIEAIETCEVIQWSVENFRLLQQEIPAFFVLQESIRINSFKENQNRIYRLLSNTAEENFRHYLQAFPQLHNRVPLHMIAAYLGVTRETLTRIRATVAHL
jgi:CRP-like cAMP-binding protein